MSANKRGADVRVRDVEGLMDRRHFALDPERWAAFQAALEAPARPNPCLETLLQTLKAHAWKLIPVALSNAHRHAPTHSPSTISRNIDVHRGVPVSDAFAPGFGDI